MDIELLSLDRIPLPSLEVYTFLSVLAASCSLYYFWIESHLMYLNLLVQQGTFITSNDTPISSSSGTSANIIDTESDGSNANNLMMSMMEGMNENNVNVTLDGFTWRSIHWASQQPHCVWPLVNFAYCLLILLSHSVQKSVFGNLRASEQENVKDQFWNLVFYKVVFVFGVVNVQEVEDAVGWCFFVSVIGFLSLARQLCKERHNYLILMNDWTPNGEIRRRRILGLLSFIFFSSITLFVAVCGWYMSSSFKASRNGLLSLSAGQSSTTSNDEESIRNYASVNSSAAYDFNLGLHSAIFMLSEIGLLIIQTLHALTVCIFEQVFFKHKGDPRLNEDKYTSIAHSINFKFDLVAMLFDLVHHVHMLVCCNLFLSMTSLIVSLQMRTRVRQIHAVLKKRHSYLWLSKHIDQYPDASSVAITNEEGESDNCAICWEVLSKHGKAKTLPCHHMFHSTCLRKWLLVSMICPTCRLSLMSREKQMKYSARSRQRRFYYTRPDGVWGFLQTGQTLLDLFGGMGWDPQTDDVYVEVPSTPTVPLFTDFGVQDWTVETRQQDVREPEASSSQKRD